MIILFFSALTLFIPRNENKAYAVEETSSLTLSVDKVNVTAGIDSEFVLKVVMSTSRTDCIWYAMDMTIGVLNADGTAFDPVAAKGINLKTNSRKKPKVTYDKRLNDCGYIMTCVDSFTDSGCFRFLIYSGGPYMRSDEAVTFEVPFIVESDAVAHSITFGALTGKNGGITNTDGYSFGNQGPTDKPAKFGVCDGLIAVQTATVNINTSLLSLSVDRAEADSEFVLTATLSTGRTDCIWFAMDITIGVLNADGTAFDAEAAKGLSIKTNSRNIPKVECDDEMIEYGYSASPIDRLNTEGYFRLLITTGSVYMESEKVIKIQIPIEISGDFSADSITFGVMQGDSYTITDGVAFDKKTEIVDKFSPIGNYAGLIGVQNATITVK